jgi:hypothetical protein
MEAVFGFFFAIAVIAIVIFIIVQASRPRSHYSPRRGSSRKPSISARKPPAVLGVPEKHPAWSVALRLETSLTADFEERVKDRVLKETPTMREGEWQWLWFELKRYFLMCAILRGVPMYSVKVDDVWHEMLMFTREYEQFCKALCGGIIHHAPHTADAKPETGERAWFDWVYGELFEAAPASGQLWGSFYKFPLPPDRIRELEASRAEELKQQFFNRSAADLFPDINETVFYLIERGKALAAGALRGERRPVSDPSNYQSQWSDPAMMTGMLSGALFYSSLHDTGDFNRQMDDAQTKEQREHYSSSAGYSYVCSGDSGSNNGGGSTCNSCSSSGGDGGGGSSSCSSGSSCSSSSSCGGGSCGGGGGD